MARFNSQVAKMPEMDQDKWNLCVGTQSVLTHKTAQKAMAAGPRAGAPDIPKSSETTAESALYIDA